MSRIIYYSDLSFLFYQDCYYDANLTHLSFKLIDTFIISLRIFTSPSLPVPSWNLSVKL